MPAQLRAYSSSRWTSHSVRSGSWPTRNWRNSRSITVWIVGSVGPGASPIPTTPSSVCTSTISPEADVRMPPVHLSGSRRGTRTAVVCTLVIRNEGCTLGSVSPIVNHPEIVNNASLLADQEPAPRARDRGAARGDLDGEAEGRRAADRGPDRERAEDEPRPRPRGAAPARARRARRLVPVSRRGRARRLRRGGDRGARADPARAREVQLDEGGAA